MRAYSQDLRDRVLNGLKRGEGPVEIAKRFEVSRIWVYRVGRRLKKEGLRNSLQIGGHRKSCVAEKEKKIRGWIKEKADVTLSEMCERLKKEGVFIKTSGLWHQLNKWNLTYKKNASRKRTRARRRGYPA